MKTVRVGSAQGGCTITSTEAAIVDALRATGRIQFEFCTIDEEAREAMVPQHDGINTDGL